MENTAAKSERFKTVASRRVLKVLHNIKSLSRCANTDTYIYTSEDVDKMLRVIKSELETLETLYRKELDENNKFSF